MIVYVLIVALFFIIIMARAGEDIINNRLNTERLRHYSCIPAKYIPGIDDCLCYDIPRRPPASHAFQMKHDEMPHLWNETRILC